MPKNNVVKADFGGRAAVPKKGKDDVIESLGKLTKQAKELSKAEKKKHKRFDKEFKALAKQTGADTEDFRADQTQRAMYRSMIAMIMEIVPTALEKYLESKSESAFYALRGANDQLLQLMQGIRTLDSLEEQSDHVVMRIIMPTLVNLMSSLVVSFQTVKAQIDSLDIDSKKAQKVKQLIDVALKEHASYITENQKALKANVEKYLVGDA